jgi:hypothetical protein
MDVVGVPPKVDSDVATIRPTQLRKPLREYGNESLRDRIVFIAQHEQTDTANPLALRPRRQRPRRRSAEPRDE